MIGNALGGGNFTYLDPHRASTLRTRAAPAVHSNAPCSVLADFLIAHRPAFIIAGYTLSDLRVEGALNPESGLKS